MSVSRGRVVPAAAIELKPELEPTIVEMGQVRTVLVTGFLPLENTPDYVRMTCLEDHPWGGAHGPERHVIARLALTPNAVADLVRMFAGVSLSKRGSH